MKKTLSENIRRTIFRTLAMVLTAVFCGTTSQSGTGKTSCPDESRIPVLLFVIEADDFSCPLCMESWMGLLDSLPVRSWNGTSFGILTFSAASDSGLPSVIDRESILQKQLVGFRLGWHLDIPFLFDSEHAFSGFSTGKSRIVLINPRSGMIRTWPFPMDSKDRADFFQGLKDSRCDTP